MLGLTSVLKYLKEVRGEMNLVSWPTRNQTIRLTGLVIIVSIVVGLVTGALDYLFTEAFRLLIAK